MGYEHDSTLEILTAGTYLGFTIILVAVFAGKILINGHWPFIIISLFFKFTHIGIEHWVFGPCVFNSFPYLHLHYMYNNNMTSSFLMYFKNMVFFLLLFPFFCCCLFSAAVQWWWTRTSILGYIMGTPINKRIDIFFSLIGCALFVACGILVFKDWDKGYNDLLKTDAMNFAKAKASLSIANGILFLIDVFVTFRE